MCIYLPNLPNSCEDDGDEADLPRPLKSIYVLVLRVANRSICCSPMLCRSVDVLVLQRPLHRGLRVVNQILLHITAVVHPSLYARWPSTRSSWKCCCRSPLEASTESRMHACMGIHSWRKSVCILHLVLISCCPLQQLCFTVIVYVRVSMKPSYIRTPMSKPTHTVGRSLSNCLTNEWKQRSLILSNKQKNIGPYI